MDPAPVRGNIIDLQRRTIYPGEIRIVGTHIESIRPATEVPDRYILPGFTDAHIHIESSMLTPYEFARKALVHGTVATVSDPHEIANVCGMEGVLYMIENAREAGLKINFGAPSCVPATGFETAGAALDARAVEALLLRDDIRYLSEMMNYPGVLMKDPEVMEKIQTAHRLGKPVDGHAPGLRGDQARHYIAAGISTDHECFTLEEAQDKVAAGMKILIREGSAARNFEALHPLITTHTDRVMFCSDDKHPDELLHGHINQLVKRALGKGHALFDVLQCACINPVEHYGLPVGLLRPGDPADFIVVNDPAVFDVLETWINGRCLAADGASTLSPKTHTHLNRFHTSRVSPSDFAVPAKGKRIRAIEALDGQLVTQTFETDACIADGLAVSDVSRDVLKIAVVNRYEKQPPAVAFIHNFGLQGGAIASTVAHDSHNIIAVGVTDADLSKAVNLLIDCKGGLSLVSDSDELVLPLPIGGLMSDGSCEAVGEAYSRLDFAAKKLGCGLRAPYMTLSFMALLVIPSLKLSDRGLFDGNRFAFTATFL